MSNLQSLEFTPVDRTKIALKYGITVDVPSEDVDLIEELQNIAKR